MIESVIRVGDEDYDMFVSMDSTRVTLPYLSALFRL